MIRRAAFVLCALMSALLPAFGQIPDRPVRVIVPFTPAGTSDIVARILVNAVAADFPRGIFVENKGGAGGNLGMARRRARRPTARRWCNARSARAAPIPRCTPTRDSDLARDFTPVILTGAVRNVMTVRKDLPATSLREVIALAKAQPGKLTSGRPASAPRTISRPSYCAAGWASTGRMCRIAAAARRSSISWAGVSTCSSTIFRRFCRRSGPVTSARSRWCRRSACRSFPTCRPSRKSGVPGIVIDSWFGFLAPAATPPSVVAALNAAFGKALDDPAVRARMAEVGVIPLGGTPERMGEHMRSEVARWGAVIRENNPGSRPQ